MNRKIHQTIKKKQTTTDETENCYTEIGSIKRGFS